MTLRTPPITMIDVSTSYEWFKPLRNLPALLRAINDSASRGQYFCFQHTHDLSKLSSLFLLWRTFPASIEYKIHIGDIRVEEPNSYDGQATLAGLERYANDVLSATRGYRDRLVERNIIHDSSPFSDVDLLTCPVCHSRLQNCGECNVAACSNNGCAGSQVVNIEKCDDHGWVTCHDCLDWMKVEPASTTFVRCPSCTSWTCSAEVRWCPGRVIHPPLGSELVGLCSKPGFDRNSVVRSHSPMPGPCESCIESGHVNAWQECAAYDSVLCPRASFGYNVDVAGAYCPECIVVDKGQHCVCGDVLVCDACFLNNPAPTSYPDLISCPCCKALYCMEGNGQYCHFCQICLRTGLCFGCQAREKSDAGEGDETGEGLRSLKVYERCGACQLWMCNECCSTARNGVIQCPYCHVWVCGHCTGDGRHSCA